MFFASFCHKRKRGCGGRVLSVNPSVNFVDTSPTGGDHPATPHAVRFYASKALKGVWGENKSFPPTVFRNILLFRIFRQAEPLSVLVLILAVLTLLVLAVLLILLGSVLVLLVLVILI